jgi:hypothetical protein
VSFVVTGDEAHDELDYRRHVYWTETVSEDGQSSLWSATLFAVPLSGHEGGISTHCKSSLAPYVNANAGTMYTNAGTLFAGKAEPRLWELRAGTGARRIKGEITHIMSDFLLFNKTLRERERESECSLFFGILRIRLRDSLRVR